jgi:hypothetical protein
MWTEIKLEDVDLMQEFSEIQNTMSCTTLTDRIHTPEILIHCIKDKNNFHAYIYREEYFKVIIAIKELHYEKVGQIVKITALFDMYDKNVDFQAIVNVMTIFIRDYIINNDYEYIYLNAGVTYFPEFMFLWYNTEIIQKACDHTGITVEYEKSKLNKSNIEKLTFKLV